jgi:ornithine carbamoyltransferase
MLGDDAGFGARESLVDFTRVLGGLVDAIVVRAKKHETVEAMAEHAGCSVINGLTDQAHPCQALADLYTLRERSGNLEGKKLAWVGDGNNVLRSLARGASYMGMELAVCTPPGYELPNEFVEHLNQRSRHGPFITPTLDPLTAVRDAAAVYTDVWASMGQEAEQKSRQQMFAAYQVNAALMARAPGDAVFMHCLPARRGEEVTDEVIDGPQSIVLEQAANRMHVQKGILTWLLGANP